MNSQKEVFETHKRIIIETCLKHSPATEAIILYGSYGRGEGSWYQGEKGNWSPYNDYDIIVLTDSKKHNDLVQLIENELLHKLPIKWVDISLKSKRDLRSLKPTIANFDLKHASSCLYGDASYTEAIPEIDSKTLPLREGLTLYFTRLYALLSASGPNPFQQQLEKEDARYFRNQLAKASLAAIDAKLLLQGEYYPSYIERQKRFSDRSSDENEIRHSEWALAEKLTPKSTPTSPEAALGLQRKTNSFFFTQMRPLLSNLFGHEIKTAQDLSSQLKYHRTQLLRRAKWTLSPQGRTLKRRLYNNIAMGFLAEANPLSENDENLTKAINSLLKIGVPKQNITNWEQTRNYAIRIRDEIK